MNKRKDEEHEGILEQANRKRNNIIRHARPKSESVDPADYAEALTRLDAYLAKCGKRHTPERLFVLKKIYECQAPVDIQTLYEMVCNEEGLVSLATIYNNLALLVDAGLVRRLDLVGGKMAFFERVVGQMPHGYLICDACGSIRVLEQPDIEGYKLPSGFRVNDVTFHIHGLCKRCQTALRRQKQRDEQASVASKTTQNKRQQKNKTTK